MTFEELYGNLYDKYGESFNWEMLPLSGTKYRDKIENEIMVGHFLYGKKLYTVAKCIDNDDFLLVTAGNDRKDLYIILHLTHNDNQDINYPEYFLINDIYELEKYLIKQCEDR